MCFYLALPGFLIQKHSLAIKNSIAHCVKMFLFMDFKFLSSPFTASCSTMIKSQLKHPLYSFYKW